MIKIGANIEIDKICSHLVFPPARHFEIVFIFRNGCLCMFDQIVAAHFTVTCRFIKVQFVKKQNKITIKNYSIIITDYQNKLYRKLNCIFCIVFLLHKVICD